MSLLSHLLAWLWAGPPPALYQYAQADLEDGTRCKRAPAVCAAEQPPAAAVHNDAEEKRVQDLLQRNTQLSQANASLTAELAAARAASSRATAASAALQSRIAELEAHTSELCTALDSAHAAARQRASELPRTRGGNDQLRVERASSAQALSARAQEVRSLQAFLDKTDGWTGAQVMQAVEDVNAEVVQLAAGVADTLGQALVPAPRVVGEEERGVLGEVLGDVVLRMLATRDHGADGLVVQMALQAWAVHCCAKILQAFCAGLPPEVDEYMIQLFGRMHRSEPQPTSARWRALAHSHSRTLLPSSLSSHLSYHTHGASLILSLSGSSPTLSPRHAAGLARLAERAFSLRCALSEDVMSASYVVCGAPPRVPFDAEAAEDVFRGASPAGPAGVLCATALGVVCERRVDGEEEGVVERTVLLKPKVLLDSAEELL